MLIPRSDHLMKNVQIKQGTSIDKLVETYCDVDDFCQMFIEQWQQQLIENGELKRHRACKLSPAEIITILIHFQQSHYRDFKSYYLLYVCRHLNTYFPTLLSYTRFLGMTESVVIQKWSPIFGHDFK